MYHRSAQNIYVKRKKLKLDIGGIYVRVHDLMIILCTTLLHLHVNEKKKAKKGVGRPNQCSEIWMAETETETETGDSGLPFVHIIFCLEDKIYLLPQSGMVCSE